jgi:integrase
MRLEIELTDAQLAAIAERVAMLVAAREERWFTQKELAAHLGCSARTILNYQRAGMPHLMVGTKPRFKASACEAWLTARGAVGRLQQSLTGRRSRRMPPADHPPPDHRRQSPMAKSQANRKCTCGCGRPGKYLGRLEINGEAYFLGYFATKQERQTAREAKRRELAQSIKPKVEAVTCNQWADRWLAKRERDGKASSLSTARQALKAFREAFGERPIGSIEPVEAEDWTLTVPKSSVPPVVTMMGSAVPMRVIDHNPFSGLGRRGKGRSEQDPPTEREFQALLDACDVLGGYADQMRALLDFATYTLMRPSELYELRWEDIDFAANRIRVSRRLYRGEVDVPKGGKPKTIALPPPDRDVLMRQPTRAGELVFQSKDGKRLTAPLVCGYWRRVRDRAGLEHDFYNATKHFGCHRLYQLGLSKRAIGAQAGWSEDAVDSLLRVYGHTDLVALAEVDALYATGEERAGATA